jgi:predicted acyltransferase
MNEPNTLPSATHTQRLLSLDFLRGLIMVILVLGETDIFFHLHNAYNNAFTGFLHRQFRHSEWHGLRFWDLLLPAFMFIAGASMAFSYNRQKQLNYSWKQSLVKTLKRSGWLLFWGVLIYSVKDGRPNLQFSNVLTELAFATLISFLLIRRRPAEQLAVSILLLLITELLYRFSGQPGFNQPFTEQHNFGNYVDLLVLGNAHSHYSSTFNIVPSSVSTIWGLMAGQLLLSDRSEGLKLRYLLAAGLLALAIGFGLDLSGITPMLKWIASSSFVFATGGVAFLALAVCHEWIDVRRHRRHLRFFTIVGMNSIFIYLFFSFIGANWLYQFADSLIGGLLSMAGLRQEAGLVLSRLAVFAFEWYLCYFLYKRKIFFKL